MYSSADWLNGKTCATLLATIGGEHAAWLLTADRYYAGSLQQWLVGPQKAAKLVLLGCLVGAAQPPLAHVLIEARPVQRCWQPSAVMAESS
jgi:hypothetical protein